MNLIANDTSTKLFCCSEAFEAMIEKGEWKNPAPIRLAVDAMREAITALASDPNKQALEGTLDVLRAVESFLDGWSFEPGDQQSEADGLLTDVRAALAYAVPTDATA